ncbi:MAG: T9SS type A sorting domain-containing protein [Bacteroidota bacterium]
MKSKSFLAVFFTSCILVNFSLADTAYVPDNFSTIQAAIDYVGVGDTVLVAPGHYVENINFNGKDIVLASHYILNLDTALISQTIIDGDNRDAAVKFENFETEAAQLIGFTIEKGTNFMDDPDINGVRYGGAIVCINASPVIRNNVIRNSQNMVFNDAYYGGIYCENSSAKIIDNTLENISSYFVSRGGSIVALHSNIQIIGNRLLTNGGGYCWYCANVVADSSDLYLERNVVLEGMYDVIPYTASLKLNNSSAFLLHNTLLGEVGLSGENVLEMVNNIIWPSFLDSSIVIMQDAGDQSIVASYNNVKGGVFGAGIINLDPMFVDAGGRDFRLQSNSPCIDAGNPFSLDDPDGTIADLGALYFDQSVTSIETPYNYLGTEVFPNPASSVIHFQMTESQNLTELLIMDRIGRVIVTKTFSGSEFAMDCSKLSPGLYFFELKSDGVRLDRGKFIICQP